MNAAERVLMHAQNIDRCYQEAGQLEVIIEHAQTKLQSVQKTLNVHLSLQYKAIKDLNL